MKKKQVLALCMTVALTIASGTVTFAEEPDGVNQETAMESGEDSRNMDLPDNSADIIQEDDNTQVTSSDAASENEVEQEEIEETDEQDAEEENEQNAYQDKTKKTVTTSVQDNSASALFLPQIQNEAAPKTGTVEINETSFPDQTFREYVSNNFDKDKDGFLSQEELTGVTAISVSGKTAITSLKGIEYFTELKSLHCYSTGITALDVSANTKLTTLSCYSTAITSLDVTNLTALKYLYCNDTGVTSLDVSNCSKLERLVCNNTRISSLNVSNNPALTRIECDNTGISSLDVSNNLKLMTLSAQNTKLTTLNLEVNNDLQTVHLEGSPIYAMTVGDKTIKTKIYLDNAAMDFKIPTETVDLTTLLPGIDPDKVTIVSGGKLNGNILSGYKTGTPVVYTYDYGQAKLQPTLQVTLNITVAEDGVEINETNFPDDAFREYVSDKYDKNDSGVLTEDEIESIKNLKLENNKEITDLTGVEYFTSMTILNCKNSTVSKLDVSKNTGLKNLNCADTQVNSLDVTNNPKLEKLYCSGTQIDSLNVSNNPKLIHLECNDTEISSLDVTNNPDLTRILCQNTNIDALDLSSQTDIAYLDCSNTNISSLDVSKQSNLQNLYCGDTEISELNLTANPKLNVLDVENANLSTLDVSGTKVTFLYCKGNPLYALYVGDRGEILSNQSTLPENTVLNLNVPSPSFDLAEELPGIDVSKITIVSGGVLNGTVLSGYTEGTPVVYTYEYGSVKETVHPENLMVTLNLTITSVPVTGLNQIPVIHAEDKMIAEGTVFDAKADVTASDAEDGDITEEIEIIANDVDVETAGTYKVIYKITDSQGASSTKTITVTVNPKMEALNAVPEISADDKTLTEGDDFDVMQDVAASDKEDGDITTKIEVVKNSVDTSKAGTYEVTYKVTDSQGASAIKTIIVTVNPKMEILNAVPTINAEDKTLTEGDAFEAMENVTAADEEDGDITAKIEIIKNNVDTSKAGTYEVTYKVTDSQGASVTKTITVTVKEKETDEIKPGNENKPGDGSDQTENNKPVADNQENTGNNKSDNNAEGKDKNAASAKALKTGDNANLAVWISLAALSGGTAVLVVRRKRKI